MSLLDLLDPSLPRLQGRWRGNPRRRGKATEIVRHAPSVGVRRRHLPRLTGEGTVERAALRFARRREDLTTSRLSPLDPSLPRSRGRWRGNPRRRGKGRCTPGGGGKATEIVRHAPSVGVRRRHLPRLTGEGTVERAAPGLAR